MDVLRNPTEKVLCPYNQAHYILRHRMETHLKKCRANYDGIMVECDFNTTHRIAEPELQYHHETCPDRKKLEVAIYQEENSHVHDYAVTNLPVPVDDSWDDVEVKSYDPNKYCEENKVLRRLDTASASVKKNFRQTERHRINNLMNEPKGEKLEPVGNKPAPSKMQTQLPSVHQVSDKTLDLEPTPDSVASIMANRLRLGRNKAYIAASSSKDQSSK